MLPIKRYRWLLVVFALPICLLWGLAQYASLGKGRAEKIGMFIAFVPGIVILTVMWGTLWALSVTAAIK